MSPLDCYQGQRLNNFKISFNLKQFISYLEFYQPATIDARYHWQYI